MIIEILNECPNIKCGDQLRVVGLKHHDGPFEGIVHESEIRESLYRSKLISYSLISVDYFPPESWAYPGNGNQVYLHFTNGRWVGGVFSEPLSVEKMGHIDGVFEDTLDIMTIDWRSEDG
ncbi:hypothetical protein LCGC14_0932810 [marine sediment metagenome]|uniref:Uncharacterized protein n=1 Tax=marine sediment metagenome TaxID=412755 RepID=A0A0F9NS25_9ZZZZ